MDVVYFYQNLTLIKVACICFVLQIRTHCTAFRQGMADLINLEWLRMFDHHELQTLISGAMVPVNIEDLKQHTHYSGFHSISVYIKILAKVWNSWDREELHVKGLYSISAQFHPNAHPDTLFRILVFFPIDSIKSTQVFTVRD